MTIDITELVIALIGILFAVITTYVVPWVKAKMKNEKLQTVMAVATQVVQAAHELQITGDLVALGVDKATYAWNEAKKALAAKNITVDDDELTAYIKAAVTKLRETTTW